MARPVKLRSFRIDWPLLGKELLEQSARKQLYIVRVVYALVLFGAFCFYYLRNLAGGPMLAMGKGLGPFNFLVSAQTIAIFLFLPPMMAGALAREKERDTLGLLFLTDLTPWELILQKYVGRLIPMLTLLFLSLPLLAVTYSLGGVSVEMLCISAVSLFLTCLWVGALALQCSAHEGSTFQALIRCWGFCLLFAMCCSFAPLPFAIIARRSFASGMMGYGFGLSPFSILFVSAFYLLPTLFFLVRAKHHLEARAFVQRRNPFGHQFKLLDQYWKDLRKLVRAILRNRDKQAYAVAQEIMQKQLGTTGDFHRWSLSGFLFARMQVPTLLSLVIIIGFIVLIFLTFSMIMNPKSAPFFVVVWGMWILAVLTVPVQSANAVASERMNERLEPLLTTPLTGKEILAELQAPVNRWIQMLTKPFLFVFLVEGFVTFSVRDSNDGRWTKLISYFVISLSTLVLYPRLMQWLCLWIGLRIRNQMRAIMTSFLSVIALCILSVVASNFLHQTDVLSGFGAELLNFLSPITIIHLAETIGRNGVAFLASREVLTLIVMHFGCVGAAIWFLRRLCLRKADTYLGRV